MLALVLALVSVFGVHVYDAKSTITLDTTSAVLTMSELRTATAKLEDYAVLKVADSLQTRRHVTDSTALASMTDAYKNQVKATDSTKRALTTADSARTACVADAAVIERKAKAKFWTGLGIGAGGGLALSVVTFVVGFVFASR